MACIRVQEGWNEIDACSFTFKDHDGNEWAFVCCMELNKWAGINLWMDHKIKQQTKVERANKVNGIASSWEDEE